MSVAFFLFFGYCGLVTGNINHPVSPNVCGGIGNLTKGVNGLCCMELTAKILGICKEYEAQEIVQEIANSLTMPID